MVTLREWVAKVFFFCHLDMNFFFLDFKQLKNERRNY